MPNAAAFLCNDITAPGAIERGIMRTFVLATACIVIFATAPSMAQDCAAIQAACIDQCQGTAGSIDFSSRIQYDETATIIVRTIHFLQIADSPSLRGRPI
jgi:hypothetical protein